MEDSHVTHLELAPSNSPSQGALGALKKQEWRSYQGVHVAHLPSSTQIFSHFLKWFELSPLNSWNIWFCIKHLAVFLLDLLDSLRFGELLPIVFFGPDYNPFEKTFWKHFFITLNNSSENKKHSVSWTSNDSLPIFHIGREIKPF